MPKERFPLDAALAREAKSLVALAFRRGPSNMFMLEESAPSLSSFDRFVLTSPSQRKPV